MTQIKFDFLYTVVAGVGHAVRAGSIRVEDLRLDDPITLHREPKNAHDANAIRLDHEGCKLGYIQASQAAWMASMLDHGYALTARVAMVDGFNVTIVLELPSLRAA